MSRGQRFGAALTTFIAFAVGVITLLSLLLGNNGALFGGGDGADRLSLLIALPASIFVRLVAITIAVTIIIGILNLVRVHLSRVFSGRLGGIYSLILLLSFGGTIAFYVLRNGDTTLLETVQVPIESSLAGLLFITLVYGGFRIMRTRPTRWSVLFVIVLLIVLIGTLPFAQLSPVRQFSAWLMAVPVSGGARGILLGIAIATVVTGIRVVVGQDRSYRG